MAGIKSLAKDTAIYGLSSIVGRFLNYLLVPLYTAVLPAASGGYGVVSNVYAYTALILVLLTFGMETGFFRFANKSDEDAQKVYANSLLFVGGLSLLFVVLCMVFLHPLSALLEYPDHPDYIAMMVCVVALDSFQCIPFAYLRYKKRPVKFAAIKLLNIIGNILLNLFFLLVCPWLDVHAHETVSWFYNPDYLVGYIFVSNLIMSALQIFFFIPELRGVSYRMDKVLMKHRTHYFTLSAIAFNEHVLLLEFLCFLKLHLFCQAFHFLHQRIAYLLGIAFQQLPCLRYLLHVFFVRLLPDAGSFTVLDVVFQADLELPLRNVFGRQCQVAGTERIQFFYQL